MLHVTHVGEGDTILVHGASAAVAVSVLQQAARLGAGGRHRQPDEAIEASVALVALVALVAVASSPSPPRIGRSRKV